MQLSSRIQSTIYFTCIVCMLMLRLQRIGKPKNPTYRLIVSDKHKDTQGRNLEILGTYQPILKDKPVLFNVERIEYWMSVGAQPSATVRNLFIAQGILKGEKARSIKISKKRAVKLAEKKKSAEAAA